MKNIFYELNVIKILLVISTIASFLTKNAYPTAIVAIALVVYGCVDKYLSIYALHKNNEDVIESINIKLNDTTSSIEELNERVKHLTSKDTVKDLMSGLSSNKR